MSMIIPKNYNTRLESADNNIEEVLDKKVQEAKDRGLPIEQTLADYIAFGIANIDSQIEQLNNYKKLISEKIEEIKAHKIKIAGEIADYLENNGLDHLKGLEVSSITIKPEGISTSKKFVLDVDKEDLVERNLAHFEESIREIPKTIKINKRRGSANK